MSPSPQERFEAWWDKRCPYGSGRDKHSARLGWDEAYSAGEEDMRERAAHGLAVALRGTATQLSMQHPEWGIGLSEEARDPVAWIRDIPLSPTPAAKAEEESDDPLHLH